MLDEFVDIHNKVLAATPTERERYLYPEVNWELQSLCIMGGRGTGKTTLLCQALMKKFKSVEKALYVSADNIKVLNYGVFNLAQDYFKYGGDAIFIDEVHKYPNWSIEIKNIIDTYCKKQVFFTASASIELQKSKADLSRRVIYYNLQGLSFREYLLYKENINIPSIDLDTLLHDHVNFCQNMHNVPILKYFKEYLQHGYYPFFLEGLTEYPLRVMNIIEKIIYENIAVIYNLRQSTLTVLKKLLWLVATSKGLMPNIDKLSKNLQVSRPLLYDCFEYLRNAELINSLYYHASGKKLIRKPKKVFMHNPTLLNVISGFVSQSSHIGDIRETFFVDQLSCKHQIDLHEKGGFLVDGQFVFEVGGVRKIIIR